MKKKIIKKNNKKKEVLVSMLPPILLWGYPWFLCIEDNAYFCCGGRHTLVDPNYALVTCSVYGEDFFSNYCSFRYNT